MASLPAFRFDLAICDEAHRTAGSVDKCFAAVLDERKIRARHRLFLTATPKIDALRGSTAQEEVHTVLSMDNRLLYGRTLFQRTFRDAVDLGLLTPYKVIISCFKESEELSAGQLAHPPRRWAGRRSARCRLRGWMRSSRLCRRCGAARRAAARAAMLMRWTRMAHTAAAERRAAAMRRCQRRMRQTRTSQALSRALPRAAARA